MIILDTNVLSTLMRQTPEAAVVAWLDRQPTESVWITSVAMFFAIARSCFSPVSLPSNHELTTLEVT